jgi:hypothetical protein
MGASSREKTASEQVLPGVERLAAQGRVELLKR